MVAAAVLAVVVGAPLLALMGLTVTGARRRGAPWPLAIGSGLLFPIAWIAWYVEDGPGYQT